MELRQPLILVLALSGCAVSSGDFADEPREHPRESV
jgi:hypothetical protein